MHTLRIQVICNTYKFINTQCAEHIESKKHKKEEKKIVPNFESKSMRLTLIYMLLFYECENEKKYMPHTL